jgi:GTP-binding protein LepA
MLPWCFTGKFGGIRIWFPLWILGMLHMEIIQERLEREFNMTVITTVPNVSYHAFTKKDPTTILIVNNPSDLPEPSRLDHVEEPLSRQRSSPNLIT